jgi:hypothetical protein
MLKLRNKTPILTAIMLYWSTVIVVAATFQVKNEISATLYIF